MGKSKKSFIDKKNSSTYHVLHRSQRDVGGDGTSEVVLWPSPHNLEKTNEKVLSSDVERDGVLSDWKQKASKAGILDDYNYGQHLMPITGAGDFVDQSGHRSEDALRDVRSLLVPDDIKEVSRQLDSIALTADCMDDDVAEALFGDFEESNFEEILDDFVLTAAQEPDEAEVKEEVFDFDAHIQQLMERARKEEEDRGGIEIREHDWGKGDHAFFSTAQPLHEKDQEDESDVDSWADTSTPGVVPALNPDEERALCEKFEQTLAEYDSDEVGDLDEECEDIGGALPLEGDAQIDAALDDFLLEKKDEIFMERTRFENRRKGGSGFAALVGTSMVPAKDLPNHNVPREGSFQEVLAEADIILANPEMEPPPEEILIDGKSYFTERTRNPWDCESILTTYSNLDNNPVTIESRSRRNRKKKVAPHEETQKILLSNKTGFPLGVLGGSSGGDEEENDDTIMSINKGVARKKDESAAEKKARKEAVKRERQMARMQKKTMKEAFRDEIIKRNREAVADDVGGNTIFRY